MAASDTGLTQADYFSADLVTVTQEDNTGHAEELSDAGSSLLVDITDQKLLYAEHVYDRLYPASHKS
jgi:D-alanyl-D-alanine carboxypeptidase